VLLSSGTVLKTASEGIPSTVPGGEFQRQQVPNDGNLKEEMFQAA